MPDLRNAENERAHQNAFGKSLVETCCVYNIHIVNGRCSGDTEGNYTCIVNEGHSVVDYHIVSTELFPIIFYFNVEMRNESDHFPIFSQLKFVCKQENQDNENEPHCSPVYRFKWKEAKGNHFFIHVIHRNLETCRRNIIQCIDGNINDAVVAIVNVYTKPASNMRVNKADVLRNNQPEWWDNECQRSMQCKYSLLRRFRWTNDEIDFAFKFV